MAQQPAAAPQLLFAAQTRESVAVFGAGDKVDPNYEHNSTSESVTVTLSPCGTFMAYNCKADTHVCLVRVATGEVLFNLPESKVTWMMFSTKSSFLVTWKREDRNEPDQPNMAVYNVATGKLVANFVQKRWPALFWTADESLCLRAMNACIYVVPGNNLLLDPPLAKLDERVADVSMSMGKQPHVAIFVASRENKPGMVRVYDAANLDTPLMTHSMAKIDSADLLWNSLGNVLLVHAKTDVDATGRSYYGTSALFLLDLAGKQVWHVKMGQGDRVHDVAWAPDGTEFIAVYGEMPGNKATLFSLHADVLHQFPTTPRNTVSWSPDGRLIMIAGFGNLNGEMNIFQRAKLNAKGNQGRIGQMVHGSATSFSWSPDSRYILTCVCTPRMRVDNRVVVWKHNGMLIYQQDYPELFAAAFAPLPTSRFPARDPSPARMGQQMVTIGAKAVSKAPVYRSAFSSGSISDAIKNYKATSTSSFVGRTAAFGSGLGELRGGGGSGGAGSSESKDPDHVPGMSPEMLKKIKEAKKKSEQAAAKGAAKPGAKGAAAKPAPKAAKEKDTKQPPNKAQPSEGEKDKESGGKKNKGKEPEGGHKEIMKVKVEEGQVVGHEEETDESKAAQPKQKGKHMQSPSWRDEAGTGKIEDPDAAPKSKKDKKGKKDDDEAEEWSPAEKKKGGKGKGKKQQDQEEGSGEENGKPEPTEEEKAAGRLKNLQKKVKEIEALAKRDPATLKDNQRQKLESLPNVLKEIEALQMACGSSA